MLSRPSATVGLALLLASCSGGGARLSPSFVAVHNTMAVMGFAQSGEISEGSLGEGDTAEIRAPFRGGGCYTVVAFGSDGVRNIDVRVLDASGVELASDRTTDGQAAARFCPPRTGEYRLAVTMSEGGGSFAVTSWTGGGGPSVAPGPGPGPAVASGPVGGRGSCEEPIALEVGATVQGSTRSAAHVFAGSCVRSGQAPEQVYRFDITEPVQFEATINSDYDGALYLLTACGDLRSELACNDDAPDTSRSHIEAMLDAGTYYLVVDGFSNGAGNFDLQTSTTQLAQLYAMCDEAPALQSGVPVTGSTVGQPDRFQARCAGGARSPDRLYSLDVATRSRVRLRMQTGTHDGALYIRESCFDQGSEIGCNDDHRDTRHSMLVTTLDPGRYYVYADGYGSGSAGEYTLLADLVPLDGQAPTTGDTCASPGTITGTQELAVDTFPATDDYAGSCGGRGAPEVVYRIDVAERRRLRARLSDSEFPAALYLRRQCDQQTGEIACAVLDSPQDELNAAIQPGTYYLVVDGGNASAFGSARLDIELEDTRALEQACRSAPRLRPGRTVRGDTSSGSDRFQASCAGGARSNDTIYRLVLTRRSRVTLRSTQQYDGALYIRTDCLDGATEVACNDDQGDNRHSLIETTLDAGTYYVFVDGFSGNSQGSFELEVEVNRP